MGRQKVNCAAGTREAGLGHALLSASSSHRWINCPPSGSVKTVKTRAANTHSRERMPTASVSTKWNRRSEWIPLIRQKVSVSTMRKWKTVRKAMPSM